MRPAVFLDRDGVLNRLVLREGRAVSPRWLDEFELLPGVDCAVAALRRAGLLAVVITNQPDVARGLLAPAELELMHGRLRQLVPVEGIYLCPHDDADGCLCRKPRPGLLLKAAWELGLNLKKSWVVGDGWKDIEAGTAAGCRTVFVRSSATTPESLSANRVVSDLVAAAHVILQELHRGRERTKLTSVATEIAAGLASEGSLR